MALSDRKVQGGPLQPVIVVGDLLSPVPVIVSSIAAIINKTNGTGAGAIVTTRITSGIERLISVTVHFSASPTTSEDLTVTLNANAGVVYDTVLVSVDPSVGGITDIVYIPDEKLLLELGDRIDVAYTNTDGNTYGVQITMEEL